MKTHKLFNGFIGQEKAVELLSLNFAAIESGKPSKPYFLRGQSGLGKTHLLDVIEKFYQDLGWFAIRVNCPSEIVGERYAMITSYIREAIAPVVVLVDEAHRLRKGRVSTTRFHRFTMQATDERMLGKSISINDGEIHCPCLDWHKLTFVLATNFPGELEEAKGSTSFIGRFCDILLEDYNNEESNEILSRMITTKKLRINPETIKYVASCARGNARPLQNIVDQLSMMAAALGDKATLNREEVFHAIKLSDLFPAGISKPEVEIMKAVAARPVRQNILQTQFPNLDGKGFKSSLAYLQGSRDFVRATSKGFLLTPDGGKYLREAHKLGFKVWEKGEKQNVTQAAE